MDDIPLYSAYVGAEGMHVAMAIGAVRVGRADRSRDDGTRRLSAADDDAAEAVAEALREGVIWTGKAHGGSFQDALRDVNTIEL